MRNRAGRPVVAVIRCINSSTLATFNLCSGILKIFGDVALLQLFCQLLVGDSQGISLALPNGKPRLPGMRCVLHLLASCQLLMKPHRQRLKCEWRDQFFLDAEYEAEKAAQHDSIFGSSPEPDGAAEDAYYARQQNGEWKNPDHMMPDDCLLAEMDADHGEYQRNANVEPHDWTACLQDIDWTAAGA